MVPTPKPAPARGGDVGSAGGLKPLPTLGGGTTVTGGLRPLGPIAAVKPGVIHGRVLGDIDGRPGLEPVRGASVSITDGPAGIADRRLTTNDTGGFTVAGVTAGRYSVVVTAAGFRPATVAVTVQPGEDVPMNLTLQRQAATPLIRPRAVPSHVQQPTHTRVQSP